MTPRDEHSMNASVHKPKLARERAKAWVRESLWAVWTPLASIAARGYVAGPELADALRVAGDLAGRGFATTLCFWSAPGTPAPEVAAAYREAARAAAGTAGNCYLSVKAPELGYSRGLTLETARAAEKSGMGIHFDAHGPETADATLRLIGDLLPDAGKVGCTLPGRWSRSARDAERVSDWGIRVRVVKGQWRDTEGVEKDHRAGCLDLVECLAGGSCPVAVASHDPVLARRGLERLLAAGTPCELELLLGLPMVPALQVAQELGVAVRVYVPYGHGWLPYCFTQMARNPRILWWLLRDMAFRRSARALDVGSGTPSGSA